MAIVFVMCVYLWLDHVIGCMKWQGFLVGRKTLLFWQVKDEEPDKEPDKEPDNEADEGVTDTDYNLLDNTMIYLPDTDLDTDSNSDCTVLDMTLWQWLYKTQLWHWPHT